MTAPRTINIKDKNSEAPLAEQLAAGTQKHLSTITQLIVGSGTYTPTQVETQLNAFAALRNDVDAAKAVVKAKLADEATQSPAMRAFFLAFIAYVRAAFGNSPDVLADFGLAPKKVKAPLTAVQKAAAAKAKATREARGTKGSKARLAVKGNVTTKAVLYVRHFLGAFKDESANFARVPTLAPADTRLPLRACPRHTR